MASRSDKRIPALLLTVAMIVAIALTVEWYNTAREQSPSADPVDEGGIVGTPSPGVGDSSPPSGEGSGVSTADQGEPVMRPLAGGGTPTGREVVLQPAPDAAADPEGHARWRRQQEIHMRFQQGIAMLQQGQSEFAAAAFSRVVALNPRLSDAHVNLGFSLLGMKEFNQARDHFDYAASLSPTQGNAYYGLAMAAEGMGDLRLAISGMRTFLHMAKKANTPEIYINRARSALWEWEARLGEGPWGPTKGIPPGFTEEEVKRDGTGVGVHGMKRGESWRDVLSRTGGTAHFSLTGGHGHLSSTVGAVMMSVTGAASPASGAQP